MTAKKKTKPAPETDRPGPLVRAARVTGRWFARRGRWIASFYVGATPRTAALGALSAFLIVFMLPTKLLIELGVPDAVPTVLGFFALVPLLLAIRGQTPRTAGGIAFATWMLGKGGTIYWIVYTINHYGYIHIVPALLIFLAMIGILSSLWGFTFYYLQRLTARREEGGAALPIALLFPVAWVAQEWTQSWILSGFPWSYVGYSTAGILPLAQAGDLFGVWGLSLFVAAVNAAACEVVVFVRGGRTRFPVWPVAAAAALLAADIAYGTVRMNQVERAMAASEPFKVAVLQGNIDQNEKWRDPAVRRRTPGMYRGMAAEANKHDDMALVILPETSLPVWQDREEPLRGELRRLGRAAGTFVLTGIPSTGFEDGERVNHNSAVLISPDGEALGWYHKNRLVPFGEYVPLKDELRKILGNLVAGTGNFRAWGKYSLFAIPQGPFGVIICYETIFPDLVRTVVNQGAQFLPNITNDAWFGDTSAPHQHLQMVQMRAIEHRLYIPRAANTGISGIVDPTGRVLYQSPVYKRLYYTGEIRTMEMVTLYRRMGDVLAYLCFAGFVGLAAAHEVRERRRRQA